MAESELHRVIKNKAVDYLMNKGYRVAKAEVSDHYYGVVDAWGIDYRSLYTMGIEVKVSRSDWRNAKHKDRRLSICKESPFTYTWTSTNEMYYACPSGLIQPDEIEPSMGLLWYSPKGRFINKKKPHFIKCQLNLKMQTLLGLYKPFYGTY